MTQSAFSNVNEYIAAQPEAAQATLQRVRRIICKSVPQAEEAISYNMPTFKLEGKVVFHLAGWKKHYSLYPCAARIVDAFKDELKPYEVNNKGTVRFPLDGPVPLKLIEGLAKFRATEIRKRSAEPPSRKSKKGM